MLTPSELALEKGLARDHPVFFNAMKYHRTHKNQRLDFINNPWAVDVYLDESPFQVFIKSTQNGITEYELIRDIIEASLGRNVFHVLPNDQILQRYVHERFDKTTALTARYATWLKAGTDSVHLKQVGPGTVAYVASGSTSQFTEFAADTIIIDEMDRCDMENLRMAPERLSYSSDPKQLWVSNPTIVGYGIDELFAETDQLHWHIKCDCGNVVHPDFFKHVMREIDEGQYMVIDEDWEPGKDAHMICDKCGRKWSKNQPGVWIPLNPGASRRGRHLSKLFTARTSIGELIQNFIDAEKDDTKMTRFYNADLGLAFTAPGAKITEEMLDECIRDYPQGIRPADGVCIAGIDVGTQFHIVIGHLAPGLPGIQVIDAKAVRTPEEVIDLLKKYRVRSFVIDAMPEMRISRQIASRAGGYRCFFSKGKKDQIANGDNTITTDRTQALDNVKAAIVTGSLRLPMNARTIPDYYAHMTASTRVFDEDGNGGEGEFKWVEGSKADHFLLSTCYLLISANLLVAGSR
jgi:hypothetical protein